jgi:2-C-methyl-D-erythritol 4-phosphate cytidylyltransferase
MVQRRATLPRATMPFNPFFLFAAKGLCYHSRRIEKHPLVAEILMNEDIHLQKSYGVILGAGKGTRMPSGREPKQFIALEGKPVFLYSIEVFDACPSVDELLLVVPPGMIARMASILKTPDLKLPVHIIAGGQKRQDSSYNALKWLAERNDAAFVVIHDAARPLVTSEIVEESLLAAKEHGAAAVATRTTDTVLETRDGFIIAIPDREVLFNAQTPQVFRFDLIWNAHNVARQDGLRDATDDVQLVLRLGNKVKLVPAPPENMKITSRRDLELASLIMKERSHSRHRKSHPVAARSSD